MNQNQKGWPSSSLVLASDYDTNWQRMTQQAQTLVKSGFLPRAIDSAEKALAVMLTGQELGLGPMASFRLIDVIQQMPTLKPMGMLALIRSSHQLEQMSITDDGATCTVYMKRVDGSEHTERFGMQEASQLLTTEWANGQKTTIPLKDKANWKQQPATMRKWRAISACCRVLFSDIIMGLYTSEEVAAFTGGYFDIGDYIEGESRPVAEGTDAASPPAPGSGGNGNVDDWWEQNIASQPSPVATDAPSSASPAPHAPAPAATTAGTTGDSITDKQEAMIQRLLRQVYPDNDTSKFFAWLTRHYNAPGIAALTKRQAIEVIDMLKKRIADTAASVAPSPAQSVQSEQSQPEPAADNPTAAAAA